MPGQRIAHAELAFHPEIAEQCAFVHESADVAQVGDPPHLCMARFVAPLEWRLSSGMFPSRPCSVFPTPRHVRHPSPSMIDQTR